MPSNPIFTNWQANNAALWGHQPICMQHRLSESPLLSLPALAGIIENYPRKHYSVIHMGSQGTARRFWREGDLAGLSGGEVLEAISNGRLWLNLRQLNQVDHRFAELLKAMFDEFHERVPGFETFRHGCGILISSPGAQVYYHADLPGQMLMQIIGRKRLYVYPPQRPFITPELLEHIAVSGLEVDVLYQQWYDDYARIYDLEPGQIVYWPHMAPHRIENRDCLNVSMTLEFSSDAIRRAYIVNMANGILRYRLGLTPRSQTTSGPPFWAKAALQKLMRNSPKLRARKAAQRKIEFHLDRVHPGAIVELSSR
ncbi:MAG: cupin-like domain-containing protein [Acidobacteriaceae bacterium]|nr:cupin-like domain-containing protein [Acidobacteriaceae bacterium]